MKSTKAMAMSLLVLSLASAGAGAKEGQPTTVPAADAEWSQDGLQRTDVKGFDLVYVRPDAGLGDYKKIMLEPVSVAFHRDWGKPSMAGATRRVRAEDVQKIKEGLAGLIEEQVRAELTAGGYELVDAPGDDVLTVGLSIVNLYINAPDLPSTAGTRQYTTSVGEMTLVGELRDSTSGELLGRVLDRAKGRESMRLEFTTRIDNVAEAKSMAGQWAKALRTGLDGARSAGATP